MLRSSYGCLMFVVVFIVLLFLLNIVLDFQSYNPITLISKNMSLLNGDNVPKDLIMPIIISFVIGILSITTAIVVFNKKQI